MQNHIRYTVLASLFAAMIYVMTAFVHIPTHQGYIHVGDGIIYLAASLLPTPYAIGASAIGAGLSDYLSGYAMWVLPTMIIKALIASLFSCSKTTVINKRNILAAVPAAVICVGGYYLSGALISILSGSAHEAAWTAALADIPTNLIQSIASTVLFVILGVSLDKTGVKKYILSDRKSYR